MIFTKLYLKYEINHFNICTIINYLKGKKIYQDNKLYMAVLFKLWLFFHQNIESLSFYMILKLLKYLLLYPKIKFPSHQIFLIFF